MKKSLFMIGLVIIFFVIIAWKSILDSHQPAKPPVQLRHFAKNGVTLLYPPSMKISDATNPSYGFSGEVVVSLHADQPAYKPMNYSQEGRVTVSVAVMGQESCYAAPDTGTGKAFDGTETINGQIWQTLSFMDAGAGNRYETKLYRLALAENCYQIDQSLHYASDWTDIDMDAASQSQQAMRDIMGQVIQTINVINNGLV